VHVQAYAVFSSPDEAQRALSTKDRAFIGERFVRILRVAHSEVRDCLSTLPVRVLVIF